MIRLSIDPSVIDSSKNRRVAKRVCLPGSAVLGGLGPDWLRLMGFMAAAERKADTVNLRAPLPQLNRSAAP